MLHLCFFRGSSLEFVLGGPKQLYSHTGFFIIYCAMAQTLTDVIQ